MEIEKLVSMLIKVKQQYPTLTNSEIINLFTLKTLMEIKSRLK